MLGRLRIAVLVGSISLAVASACGGDDSASADGAGGKGGKSGDGSAGDAAKKDGASSGGKAGDASVGTGGTVATGGSAGSAGDASDCPYTGPPLIDPTTFGECSPACGGAHCVPSALVPAAQQSLLAACNGGAGFCTPDFFIASLGKAVPKSCTSVAGAEGRCLSTCLPAVAAQSSLLPQDVCEANERCTPCFDPSSAKPTEPTGACSIACDAPTKPPVVLSCPWTGPDVVDPSKLPSCASGSCTNAHCVPNSLVPAAQQALLAPCPGGGLCAPDPIIATANNFVPKSCTSTAGAEGRCLSTCLPLVASLGGVLPTSTCAVGEKCVPCYDPTSANPDTATGACSLGCDKPAQPPVHLTCPWTGPDVIDPSTLPNCGPAGSSCACLPTAYVPPAQQSQLSPCSGGFCTPDPLIQTAGNYKPPSCVPFAGVSSSADGRCLSDCLPAVSSQPTLEKSSCANGSHCAPCYDPFNGTATGACSSSSCDSAPTTKYTFPSCCIYNGSPQGRCVPKSQIPDAQESNLSQNSCADSDALCIPSEQLPAPYNTPGSACSTLLYDGTCLSSCLNLGIGVILPQGNCAANHKCVPCSQAPAGSPGC